MQSTPTRGLLAVFLACVAGCGSSSLVDGQQGQGGSGATGGSTSGGAGTGGAGASGRSGSDGTAGTGGSPVGGVGGTSVGGVGGTSASACHPQPPVYPELQQLPIGALRPPYDGPAVVERSVDDELLLAYDAPGSGGTGVSGTQHVRIGGYRNNPQLPAGAQIWLSKTADPSHISFTYPQPAEAFSVRDRRGGTLLFGGSTDAFTDASSPVAVGDIATVCTSPSPDFCAGTGATVDYRSLTVMGDTPVSVRDGERGSITLNSVPYDVRVRANVTHRQASTPCSDYYPWNLPMIDVRAKDLAALAAGLPIGALPACHQGNDPSKSLYLSPANTSYSPYEGKAIYTGRDPGDPSTYRFDIPARSPDANLPPPLFEISGAAKVMREPAVGQEFWLSFTGVDYGALLEAQGGPVVLADVGSTSTAPSLAAHLGVSVTLQDGCAYTPSAKLVDVVFGTTPAVRVRSGESKTFVTGGHSYNVWTSSRPDQGFVIVVYRAD